MVALLLYPPVSAWAQQAGSTDVCLTDAKCAELNQAARNLSREGQLDAALILYQTAYSQRPAAWLLVNIGRLQQKLYRLPAAIKSFRQYLASSDAKEDPELAKKAQEYLAQAESNPKANQTEQTPEQTDICLTDPKCAELNDTARSLSKSGQLGAALALYENAYGLRAAPWLLVNIGRIQQKLERYADAIKSYRQYLNNPDAKDDPELIKKAEEYLLQAEAEYEPPPPPLVPLPPPPPPLPPPPPPPGSEPSEGYASPEVRQKRYGLVVALGFGSRRPVVQLDATTSEPVSSLGGSVFLGYKLSRLILGIGCEIDYWSSITQLTSPAGTTTASLTTTSYLVTPGVQLALVRVAAGRLELFASALVGLGRAISERTQTPALSPTPFPENPGSSFHVNYQLGPGLRVFVMPRLALSMIAGVAGDHFLATQDSPSGLRADQNYGLSIFGSLGMLGVF